MRSDSFLSRVKRLGTYARTRAEAPRAPGPVTAFGQTVTFSAPVPAFLAEDSLWRLRMIHEPALAVRRLRPEGTAVDIGAGFGSFALPFAKAFPGWMVWCFEPDPETFAALKANIAEADCDNVVALDLAVGGGAPSDRRAIAAALEARDAARLKALCPEQGFRASHVNRGYVEAEEAIAGRLRRGARRFAVLPSEALATLAPDLVKLVAPAMECKILQGLHAAPPLHLVGETWRHVPTRRVYGSPGIPETWLPVAGAPALALRRHAETGGRHPGLDVVVAMDNAHDWIEECLESLVAADDPGIRVRVVDDGSTDGCGDFVERRFGADPRVILHRKPNDGCASAHNYGRLMSDATHIAFLHADNVADRELFPRLLELARYTGAEVVQGGIDHIVRDARGTWRRQPVPGMHDTPAPPDDAPFSMMALVRGAELMTRRPTIRGRVYRQDFLDARNIWFPEHMRGPDDLLFQLLTLQHAGEVPTLEHLRLGYRQHPGQEIRQGDERGFYALEMLRLAAKRGLQEGWPDFAPLLRCFVNTVDWTHAELRPDLKPVFRAASGELWVLMERALGPAAFREFPDSLFATAGLAAEADRVRHALQGIGTSHAFAWLDSAMMHADILRHTTVRDGAPRPAGPE